MLPVYEISDILELRTGLKKENSPVQVRAIISYFITFKGRVKFRFFFGLRFKVRFRVKFRYRLKA